VKFDRRHLVASLVLLVGSIVYNVWVFTRPETTVTRPPDVAAGVAPVSAGAPADAAPVDLTQLPALPDVALDRLPEWPRDPFANVRTPPEAVVAEQPSGPAPEATPDPDPVVASILYSSDRRAAMIDGRVVRVGDVVGRAKVVEILPRAVVVESADRGRRTLELKAPVATGGRR